MDQYYCHNICYKVSRFGLFQASLASWVTILRIMGDLPDADLGDTLAVAGVSKIQLGYIVSVVLF